MSSFDRRLLLKSAAAGLVVPALPRPWFARPCRDPIEELARKLIDMPGDELFQTIEPLMRRGLAWRDLQAAIFYAGVLEVQPRPVGFKLHCVMVVESLFQTAEAGDEAHAWRAVLWNLRDFKKSQAADVRDGDWQLPAAPVLPANAGANVEGVVSELREALRGADADRADRAVTVVLRELPRARMFEELWAAAIRDFGNLGHKPIYCSHIERTLARVGDARAQPAVRSLVYGLLDPRGDRRLGEHAASAALAAALPADWAAGERSTDASLELAKDLRTAEPAAARELVAKSLRTGLHVASVWDALRLVAADLFARRPALLPVHPTTATSALYYIHSATTNEQTRRITLLQAASWLPLYREALRIRIGPGGIDPLVAEAELAATTLEEVFAAPSPSRTRAFLERGGSVRAFAGELRKTILERGAVEHHQHKYAAAILEDVRSADPRWHAALLGTALEYLPSRASAATTFAEECTALIERVQKR